MRFGAMTGRPTSAPAVLAFMLAVTAGCGSPLPTGPSDVGATPTSPAEPTTPATTASRAVLAIEDAFAIGWPWKDHDSLVYEVRFLLRELGGRSGATPKSIAVSNPNLRPGEHTSKQDQSESCWLTELRMPPGGMLDTFYTDAGSRWLSYCSVGIDALTGVVELGLAVRFQDE